MSLQPCPVPSVPTETARVAPAAFPTGTSSLQMRDERDTIFDDAQFRSLFPARGRPAQAPWRLMPVTIFPFAEHRSDRQAADAVRGRIGWKHALPRELIDPGFDHTVLGEFRRRLLDGGAENLPLDGLLVQCRGRGPLKAGGRQRTDSTHVLAAVRALNRLELVRETMRSTLDVIAGVAPDWLRSRARPEWTKRCRRRSDECRLPKGKDAQRELAEPIGADGVALLATIADEAPPRLQEMPAVATLHRVWLHNDLQLRAIQTDLTALLSGDDGRGDGGGAAGRPPSRCGVIRP